MRIAAKAALSNMTLLDDILAGLGALPEAERKAVIEEATRATAHMPWLPNSGPQTDAYFSPADVLLYGGQGGGGKSDLGLGLAITAHRRSLILRRKYTNLGALTERALEINGSRDGFNGSPPPLLRTAIGGMKRYIQFAGCQHLGDEQDWQGQPFDLKVFDEATQFLEQMIRFHIGWIRSTDEGQRTRAVLATNPPIDADGDWIIGMFRPWLDLTHPNPAKHGELRWYVTAPDGDEVEVEDGRPVQLPGAAEPAIPMSRTFIPAALKDNPYLINSGYQAKLDGLPEPLRSAVRDGNFMAARSDAEFQVIPTAWVIAAQARWKPDGKGDLAMTAMAVDVAQGGEDRTVMQARYGGWFDMPVAKPGSETPDGSSVAGLVIRHRRDACPVVIDMGGGYGGDAYSRLSDNGIDVHRFNGANASNARTQDGSVLSFRNKRAEAWWRMREALNPEGQFAETIALPPDPELRADLCAPTWSLTLSGILIESKDDIRKRLGRSTDKGDAAVMCLSEGAAAVKRRAGAVMNRPTRANMGFAAQKQMYRR